MGLLREAELVVFEGAPKSGRYVLTPGARKRLLNSRCRINCSLRWRYDNALYDNVATAITPENLIHSLTGSVSLPKR